MNRFTIGLPKQNVIFLLNDQLVNRHGNPHFPRRLQQAGAAIHRKGGHGTQRGADQQQQPTSVSSVIPVLYWLVNIFWVKNDKKYIYLGEL